jgi:LysR family glycine cleavage system transcriptional activator
MNRPVLPRPVLPSIELLKGFEATARHLSFTKAGAELFITQSAVSRQVRQLEEQLGVRLFDRRTRALALTDVGHLYYVQVQRILLQLEEATQRIRTARTARIVRVTTTPTFASLWLIPRLSDFQRQHPHVHVHVVAENALRNLGRDDFDVAIRYSPKLVAGPGAAKLFDETLVPLCSPKLVTRRRLRSPADLKNFFLIHFNDLEGYAPWLSWDSWFEGIGDDVVEGKGALYFSHYDQAMRAALAAQGIALGRVPVVDDLLRDGRLVAPFGEKFKVPLDDKAYSLMLADRHRDEPEVRILVDWILDKARESGNSAGQLGLQVAAVRDQAVRAGKRI